jgi:hypothetical protein
MGVNAGIFIVTLFYCGTALATRFNRYRRTTMKAVNPATQMVADMFLKRAAEIPFDQHPYHHLLKAKKALSEDKKDWTGDLQQPAVSALEAWCADTIGGAVVSTLNEIVGLMRIANETDEKGKEAVQEMSSSMPFIEKVMTIFVNSVDMEHVAEVMFADGQRREAAENKPAKPPIQNWQPARWAPSAN